MSLTFGNFFIEHNTDYNGKGKSEKLLRTEFSEEQVIRYCIKNEYPIIVVTSRKEKGKYWYLKGKGKDIEYLKKEIEELKKVGIKSRSICYLACEPIHILQTYLDCEPLVSQPLLSTTLLSTTLLSPPLLSPPLLSSPLLSTTLL